MRAKILQLTLMAKFLYDHVLRDLILVKDLTISVKKLINPISRFLLFNLLCS